jgi:predicted acetyltransferase
MVEAQNITLESASEDKRTLLERLLQLYAYDFSEYFKDEISESGSYGYDRLLRYYWNTDNPDPFIIRVNGNIAGFVMVKKKEFRKTNYNSIAEFFILKMYRGLGVGTKVSQMVFKRFPGRWYVDVIRASKPACLFWEKVISDVARGNYGKFESEDGKKIIFIF